jgi:hypothetical protein
MVWFDVIPWLEVGRDSGKALYKASKNNEKPIMPV